MNRATLLVVLCLGGCASLVAVPPFTNVAGTQRLPSDERRIWDMCDEAVVGIERSGQIEEDEACRAYLQSIVDKLYPEFEGSMPVEVLTSPVLNAFCLANGAIYVNSGIIASAENEAQIAAILAHEGVHFTHRHVYQRISYAKNASAVALAISLTGIPLVGELASYSSIFGFSRENEREADVVGFQRLVAAGYDPAEATVPFEHLIVMSEALGEQEPFFFSTHPKLQERVDSFEQLAATVPAGGYRGEEEFRRQTEDVLLIAVEESLARARYKAVILALEDERTRDRFPVHSDYYLGEAYRHRGESGDDELSLEAYGLALLRAPHYAPTYRALGRHHVRSGDVGLARQYLQRYLAMAPGADDRAYVEQTLAGLP